MSKYNSTQAEKIKEIAAYLKEQRVQQGLSIEQIASMTFIRLPMIKALETSNIGELPELVYVQGFIRRYGEALQIDGNQLSQQLTASAAEKIDISPDLFTSPAVEDNIGQEVPCTPVSQENYQSVATKSKPRTLVQLSDETSETTNASWPKKLHLYWVYLLILGGATGGLFYLLSRPPATEQTAQSEPTQTAAVSPQPTQPQETTQTAAVSPQPTQPEEISQPAESSDIITQPETPVATEEPSPVVESPQGTSETTNNLSEVAENAPIPTETPNDITRETTTETAITAALQLEGDSWLQVKVDGEVEYEGILQEGEEESWNAEENLTIRVGNAGVVKLSVNDEPAEVIGELGEVKTVELTGDS
ncbi:helix-turn-helix domain-containing protein [Crocosphaera sp. Alani8]|uniref:helix-turn-helix domain-containing protein n=1 Tax=Crocosphaera sp. Alani8 TaxID=3038952 RepID=UPI00313B383E